jgi:hypothetical protein
MNSSSELISAYLTHFRTKDDSLSWAWTAVDDAMYELQPGLSLCLELIEATENEEELAYVAAGPLEDLLVRVGVLAANSLEIPVRKSIKARLALSCVWLNPEAAAYPKWHYLVQQYSSKGSRIGL